jgi:hydrogenase maturation protease
VLVSVPGAADAMLSSPIILYDYPQIAPESPGETFDGTEIDEILTLRILAMTDEEKREMAAADPRARALLERTHAMTPEDLARLHGAMRGAGGAKQNHGAVGRDGSRAAKPRLASLVDGKGSLSVGSQVRIRPKAGGDIMDIALRDKLAIVEAIERDFEDRVHIAVTLVDDPGRDLGAAGFPGHRFYFARDEIEPLAPGEAS